MMLTEEQINVLELALSANRSIPNKMGEELIRVHRLYRDAEQSGRLLPVLPDRVYGCNIFRHDNSDTIKKYGLYGCELSDIYGEIITKTCFGPTPAAAVTAALKEIEG